MKRSSLHITGALLTMAITAFAIEKADVLDTYADIAAAIYGDSLITAQRLLAAINALLAEPSAENLTAARQAWLEARVRSGMDGGKMG